MNDYYTSSTTSSDNIAGALIGLLIQFIIYAIIYVIYSLLLARIFKKAGLPQWIAWVPFYNSWKFLELGGQPGFWAVLIIVPILNIVSIVYMYIAMYYIGKNFGKSGAFVLWGIFIPMVWYIWLAVDSSKWGDRKITA